MKTVKTRRSPVIADVLASISAEELRRAQNRMALADKIASLLESKRLSQKTLAKRMHKTESEVSEWLSGNRNFTIDTLSDIGGALGYSFFDYPSQSQLVPGVFPAIKRSKTNKKAHRFPQVVSFGPIQIDTPVYEKSESEILAM